MQAFRSASMSLLPGMRCCIAMVASEWRPPCPALQATKQSWSIRGGTHTSWQALLCSSQLPHPRPAPSHTRGSPPPLQPWLGGIICPGTTNSVHGSSSIALWMFLHIPFDKMLACRVYSICAAQFLSAVVFLFENLKSSGAETISRWIVP